MTICTSLWLYGKEIGDKLFSLILIFCIKKQSIKTTDVKNTYEYKGGLIKIKTIYDFISDKQTAQ